MESLRFWARGFLVEAPGVTSSTSTLPYDRTRVDLYRALGECYFCSNLGTRVRLRLTISQQECVYLCEEHKGRRNEAVLDLRQRFDLGV